MKYVYIYIEKLTGKKHDTTEAIFGPIGQTGKHKNTMKSRRTQETSPRAWGSGWQSAYIKHSKNKQSPG